MTEEVKELKEQMQQISLSAHELIEARHERREKRFCAIIVLLILLLVGTNAAWLWYESQFETVAEETTVLQRNADGFNNYIGNDGDIINGNTDN